MDYKIVLMHNAENDLDSFISYLLFEKRSEQAAGNLLRVAIERIIKNELRKIWGALPIWVKKERLTERRH